MAKVPLSRKFLRTFGVLITLVLAGCGSVSPRGTASAGASVPITFATSGDLGAQGIIAEHLGYFKQNHLVVKLQNYSLGTDTLDAILTGQANFGCAIDFAAMTMMRSNQLRVVATIMRPSPGFYGLAVRGGISTPQGLVGKKIGIVKGTDQQYATIRYLEVNHVPLSSVHVVAFPDLYGLVAGLHTGQIDAAWVWSTGVNQAKSIPGVKILTRNNAGSLEPGYLLASKSFLNNHSAEVRNFLAALVKANHWMLSHLRQSSTIVAKEIGAPPAPTYQEMALENYTVSWNQSDASQFRAVASFMHHFGILKTTPSLHQDVILKPLSAVNANLVSK